MPDKVILAMVLSSTVGTVYCISCPRGILTTTLCIYNAIFRNHITADAHSVESTRHHLVAIACLLVESLTIQILEVICASLKCQSMRFFGIQKLYKGLHWRLQDSIERKHLQKLTALTASISHVPLNFVDYSHLGLGRCREPNCGRPTESDLAFGSPSQSHQCPQPAASRPVSC